MTRPPRLGLVDLRALAVAAICAALFAACKASELPSDAGTALVKAKTIEVLATGDVGGDTEECGCKIRQMGGIARRAKIVKDREGMYPGRTLVLDAGDLFFKLLVTAPRDEAQAKETASFLADSLAMMHTPAMAVGERDLAMGLPALRALAKKANVTLLAANLVHAKTGTAAFAPYTIVDRAGTKIGLVGAALEMDPKVPAYQAYEQAGLTLKPTEAAITEAAQSARKEGATIVIGLFHLGLARGKDVLAKLEPGLVDYAIIAHDRQASNELEPVRDSAFAQAGERGKWLLAIETGVVDRARGVVNTGAIDAAKKSLAELDARIAEYERTPPGSPDPKIAEKIAQDRKATLDRLKKRRDEVAQDLAQAPQANRHRVKAELITLDVALEEDPAMLAALNAYKDRLKTVNAATGTGADVKYGPLSYTGTEACKRCHPEADKQWQSTKHAQAWATMERTRQTANLDCIGCHTTGFDRPGGPAGLVGLDKFRNVGCESCHGPGSAHAADPKIKTAFDRDQVVHICADCHRAQADQKPFVLEDRLPKVLGPGHGRPQPAPGNKRAHP